MSVSIEKAALRKHLLEKRDATSAELRDIASERIHENLKRISSFVDAQNIACYFPIGSEVYMHNIMLEVLEQGNILLLPKIIDDNTMHNDDNKQILVNAFCNYFNLENKNFDSIKFYNACFKTF